MEFKEPKPKKNSKPKKKLVFPVINNKEVIGVFNGELVTVCDLESMDYLYNAGNFGKGSLSRGEPSYHTKKDDIPKIMLEHQFENFAKWNGKSEFFTSTKSSRNDFKLSLQSVENFFKSTFSCDEQESLKMLKDNKEFKTSHLKNELALLEFNSGEEDYKDDRFSGFVNEILQLGEIKRPRAAYAKVQQIIVVKTSFDPNLIELTSSSSAAVSTQLQNLCFAPEENLNLNLEESFFLKSILGCLNIVDLNFSQMEIPDLWKKFNAIDKNFTERYLTYHYYRSKGWVVRSGLKFGGDYLLYKDGPDYHHASCLVKVLDKRQKFTWREFLAMNRLVDTFNKDLLLINVVPSKTTADKETFPNVLTNHSIQEVLVKRWFPTKERVSKGDRT